MLALQSAPTTSFLATCGLEYLLGGLIPPVCEDRRFGTPMRCMQGNKKELTVSTFEENCKSSRVPEQNNEIPQRKFDRLSGMITRLEETVLHPKPQFDPKMASVSTGKKPPELACGELSLNRSGFLDGCKHVHLPPAAVRQGEQHGLDASPVPLPLAFYQQLGTGHCTRLFYKLKCLNVAHWTWFPSERLNERSPGATAMVAVSRNIAIDGRRQGIISSGPSRKQRLPRPT